MMETQTQTQNGGTKEVMMGNKRRVRCSELVMRFLGFGLTMVGAIVVGLDKQTKVVPLVITTTLPPIYVPATAKWHYMSAFVYFVVANAIACTYAALSLVLLSAKRGGKKGLVVTIIILDLLVVALLYSANGAAIAVGLLGRNGNSHVQWNKVCNMFGKFCDQLIIGIAMSMFGSLAFLLLILLATLNLYKKYN